MNPSDRDRPIAVVLTGSGRGAISVVKVSGPGSVEVSDRAFRPSRGASLGSTPAGRLRLGRVGHGLGDEVVAVIVGTDPPAVEIQGHGGPEAVRMVLDALEEAGAVVVRSTGPGRTIREKAEEALARCPTLRAADVLLDQASGALEEELREVDRSAASDPPAALRRLDQLLDRASFGIRLLEGWRVVLSGRPNVGKSHLLNALAGYERAIVSPTAGTTRDVVTIATAFEGLPVELADTAGLRPSEDPVESLGIAAARGRLAGADLALLVLDRSEPLTVEDHAALAALPSALRIANKADLPPAWSAESMGAVAVSARTGEGISDLVREIVARLAPEPPPAGSAVPFDEEIVAQFMAARTKVAAAPGLVLDQFFAAKKCSETAR